MMSLSQPRSSITIRRRLKRRAAEAFLLLHHRGYLAVRRETPTDQRPIKVVCISDSHNHRPVLPAGDVLIHSGNLTDNGSFDEVQGGLTWLASQPHRYKIFVAGNHDVLFDNAFLAQHPERRFGASMTKDDLDLGDVVYLEDSSVTLSFEAARDDAAAGDSVAVRTLTVFGSPWTPQHGVSAFQYRPDSEEHWAERFATLETAPDVVVIHGPPYLHLDRRGLRPAGCPFLAEQLCRLPPRLVVFGHIHESYGREDVVLDLMQAAYERVMVGWAGWATVMGMAALAVLARIQRFFGLACSAVERKTIFVNASLVGGLTNELRNPAVVVDI